MSPIKITICYIKHNVLFIDKCKSTMTLWVSNWFLIFCISYFQNRQTICNTCTLICVSTRVLCWMQLCYPATSLQLCANNPTTKQIQLKSTRGLMLYVISLLCYINVCFSSVAFLLLFDFTIHILFFTSWITPLCFPPVFPLSGKDGNEKLTQITMQH